MGDGSRAAAAAISGALHAGIMVSSVVGVFCGIRYVGVTRTTMAKTV